MVDLLEFIYDELLLVDWLNDFVWTRISYGKSDAENVQSPLVIYKEISNAKIDFKGTRNDYFQISIWWKSGLENDKIKALLVKHFHMLKKAPVKNVNVKIINNTPYNKELWMYWTHLTIHIKLQDSL